MTMLSAAELATHRTHLTKWQRPTDMASYFDEIATFMGERSFFNQAGVEFLRDAWQAAKFCQHRDAAQVRLVPDLDRWPDFEYKLSDGGTVEGVECAEADLRDRRRGQEYRVERGVEFDPGENWSARARAIPGALRRVSRLKAAKNYPSKAVSLLINLNIGTYRLCHAEIVASMRLAISPALPGFRSVCVLWGGELFGPWSE